MDGRPLNTTMKSLIVKKLEIKFLPLKKALSLIAENYFTTRIKNFKIKKIDIYLKNFFFKFLSFLTRNKSEKK